MISVRYIDVLFKFSMYKFTLHSVIPLNFGISLRSQSLDPKFLFMSHVTASNGALKFVFTYIRFPCFREYVGTIPEQPTIPSVSRILSS